MRFVTEMFYLYGDTKNEVTPHQNGRRITSIKRKHEFPHCQYMQFPKKVKRDFVMNVEITE